MPVDTTAQLEMRWVAVSTPDGRTRMESVWLDASTISTDGPASIPVTAPVNAPATALASPADQAVEQAA